MAYPSQPKFVYDNPEGSIKPPTAPMAAAPQPPAVAGPMGGAPKIQPWTRTNATTNMVTLPPSPFSLKDIGEQYKPAVDRIRESLRQKYAGLTPEQRREKFWQGFEQYPEAMAQMVTRRTLTNHYYNQVERGPVGQWMSWIDKGRR